jgi:hypothetical protein
MPILSKTRNTTTKISTLLVTPLFVIVTPCSSLIMRQYDGSSLKAEQIANITLSGTKSPL